MAKKITQQLKKFDKQRIIWLYLSIFILLIFFVVVLNWTFILSSKISWLIFTITGLIGIAWWYWTMIFVRKILEFKNLEIETMNEIIDNLKKIKQNLPDKS